MPDEEDYQEDWAALRVAEGTSHYSEVSAHEYAADACYEVLLEARRQTLGGSRDLASTERCAIRLLAAFSRREDQFDAAPHEVTSIITAALMEDADQLDELELSKGGVALRRFVEDTLAPERERRGVDVDPDPLAIAGEPAPSPPSSQRELAARLRYLEGRLMSLEGLVHDLLLDKP